MAVQTKAGNVADTLKAGGLTSLQAEQVGNQISNAFRSQLSKGPVQVDYTPDDMRLITAQARKYRYTNLDWEDSRAYRNSKRDRKRPQQENQLLDPSRHPLSSSQPITVTQAINEDQVFPGPYTDVLTQRKNGFAVHTIGLRLGTQQGTHCRFNESTKTVEGVPIKWDIDQNQFLKGSVKELPQATVIHLSLENLRTVSVRVADVGGSPAYQNITCWTDSGSSSSSSPAQSLMPTGAILPLAHQPATLDGWLLCNGLAVSRTTYAALFAAIGGSYGVGNGTTTFNLPDLRDRFLRGSGGTSGAAIGTVQGDSTKLPTIPFTTNTTGSHRHSVDISYTGNGFGYSYETGNTVNETPGFYTNSDGAHTHTITDGGDAETRPKNYAVPYYIKT